MTAAVLDVTLLGTGTSTGVPVPGCHCDVCRSHTPENQRTRCSLLLQHAGHSILIDTATDLRQQALREGLEQIDAVLYTHTHADHMHGIDDLRPFNRHGAGPIPVYGDAESIAAMQENFRYIFAPPQEHLYRPRLAAWTIGGPFSLYGLPVTPVPLLHGDGTALGYRIGPLAYLTDCSAIPPASLALLNGLELLIIDALRFRPHAAHFHVAAAVAMAEQIGARQTLLTHLSHEVDYQRHGAGLPEGIQLAHDGLRRRLRVHPTD
jgi:phosphoribosyl 1,2-cyclic phosphate phosphodiesterase